MIRYMDTSAFVKHYGKPGYEKGVEPISTKPAIKTKILVSEDLVKEVMEPTFKKSPFGAI